MADEKRTLDEAFKAIGALQSQVSEANRQITAMQKVGGFADSKTLGLRSSRIEERLEKVEFDSTMLKDVVGMLADWLALHLFTRHAISERDNAPDAIVVRKVRRRLAEWADRVGLMGKRRAVTGARNEENRLRPQQQAADS